MRLLKPHSRASSTVYRRAPLGTQAAGKLAAVGCGKGDVVAVVALLTYH